MGLEAKKPFNCPVEATIALIGGKDKTLRYSEIHRLVPKATDKMLAQQLRELESDGLINRKVYPVVPPKTEYSLTSLGESIIPVLSAMCDWGTEMVVACNGASSSEKECAARS